MQSLLDRQFCTKGLFRVYRISIAILLLTQQRNFTISGEIKYYKIKFIFLFSRIELISRPVKG